MASCWLLLNSFSCAWNLHRLIAGLIWLCWCQSIHITCNRASWLESRVARLDSSWSEYHSCWYVRIIQYGVRPYLTHAFRHQSADSSGFCVRNPTSLVYRHRFVVMCRGAYAVCSPRWLRLLLLLLLLHILYITYICDGFIDIGIHIHAIKTYMNASCKES